MGVTQKSTFTVSFSSLKPDLGQCRGLCVSVLINGIGMVTNGSNPLCILCHLTHHPSPLRASVSPLHNILRLISPRRWFRSLPYLFYTPQLVTSPRADLEELRLGYLDR